MYKILVADDEVIERNYLTQFIDGTDDYGVVASAGDGQSAVELALLHRPDLAILDIRMPLLDGLQAAERIKHRLPRTVVVLNSAYAEFEFAQKAIRYGVDAYLVKPSSDDEILSVLTACLPPAKTRGPDESRSPSLMESFPGKSLEDFRRSMQVKDLLLFERSLEAISDFLTKSQPLETYRIHVVNIVFTMERICFEDPLFRDVPGNAAQDLLVRSIASASDILKIQNLALSYITELQSSASILLQDSVPPTQRIAAYLDEHFREKITPGSLGKIVFLSADHIQRIFRRETGQSIAQYLRTKRLAEAKRLLSQSNMTIQDIAESCGFGSLSSFYKAFRKALLCTPVQYRGQNPR